MAISDETRLGGGTLTAIPRARPEAVDTPLVADAPAHSTRAGRRLRRWRFAADLMAAVVASGITVACWPVLQPGRSGPLTLELFAVSALAAVLLCTTRTRALAASVGRVLSSTAHRLAVMALDVVCAGLLLVLLAAFGVFGAAVPWAAIAAVAAVSFVLVPIGRILARQSVDPVRIVLVGTGAFAAQLRRRLLTSRGVEMTAILTDAASAFTDAAAIEATCERYSADGLLVVIADPVPEDSRAQPFVRLAADQSLKPDAGPESRPDVDALIETSHALPVSVAVQLSDGGSLPIFRVGARPSGIVRFLKRGFDVAVSATALLLLSPLLLVLMACVGIDSGVPLLFRQLRLGRDREPFHILKLRTMRSGGGGQSSATGPRTPFSHPADPQLVTRFGAILRRTSLDEIPQLVNVLRGEMSLVGPRPFVPEECAALPTWADARFGARPGLTGIWQVCGQHTVSVDELCWLDLFYVRCWTVTADLRILLLTPARLLRGSR